MARPWWRSADAAGWALTVVAVVPLLAAAVRALAGDWYPIGDNAYFALRASDVLTEHHPLVGTWTSASLTVDRQINNPGPLLFDLLALPVRVDVAAGLVVAVVAMHVAMIVIAVRRALRVAGVLGAAAVTAAFGALFWAMGSELLVEPWQPHSLLPAFLAYLVLIWAVVAGDITALPWAAAVASLVLQTHLSYALLVPGLAALALGAVAVRAGRPGGPGLRRPLALSAIVLLLAWAQPLADQAFGSGNLGAVITEGSGGEEVAGSAFAARVLASVGAVPGGWAPDGFSRLDLDFFGERAPGEAPDLAGLASTAAALGWGVAALLLLAAAGLLVWRRRDELWGSAVVVAVVALLLTFVTLAVMPVSPVLGIAAHQVRPVWPVVLFTTAVVLAAAIGPWRRAAPVMAGVAVLALAVAVPHRNAGSGPSADAWAMPIVQDLLQQLDPLEGAELVHVDLSVIRFAEPYSTPVMLELERRGIDFVVDDQIAVGQLGEGRELDPRDPVDVVLRVVDGAAASTPEQGWERVAHVAGDTPRETAAVLVRAP